MTDERVAAAPRATHDRFVTPSRTIGEEDVKVLRMNVAVVCRRDP